MSGFSASWLALREPYDATARNPKVRGALAAAFHGKGDIAVVDLACGTGTSLRALRPHLPTRQHWRLVDNDLGLLAQAGTLAQPPDLAVTARAIDLARDLEFALDGPIDLVTASALLDLVSAEWLDRLAVECAARRLPVYAALSYDGRVAMVPSEAFDTEVVAAVNQHQRGNKGFGPALGPAAPAQAVSAFEQLGYLVTEGRSDWVFGPQDREIQAAMLAGWAQAADELGAIPAEQVADWLTRRLRHVAAGKAEMKVGHVDMFAVPTAVR
jgi:hypothetical protein